MMEILETNPGDSTFQAFLDLPKHLYPTDSPKFAFPESVPQDFLAASFIVMNHGKPVARASLYNNPLLHYQQQPALTVGNYECSDDAECANLLLNRIASEATTRGANYLIGPMNGSTWENYRFATDHDQPPFFLEPYHHLYYNEQFRQAGFAPIAEYFTNRDTDLVFDRPDIQQRERELRESGVTIRPIDLSRFEEEIGRIYDFNGLAFKNNFLYTPIEKTSFLQKYAFAKNILNPEFTLIAENEMGSLIGYYFCMDDVLNTREKSLIAKTLARHPDPKWRGLGHVMGNVVVRKADALGYDNMLHPFIYKDGTSSKLSAHFSGLNYRNYVLYGKNIQ